VQLEDGQFPWIVVVVDVVQVPGIDTVLGMHEGQSPDTVETPPPVVMVRVLTTIEGEHAWTPPTFVQLVLKIEVTVRVLASHISWEHEVVTEGGPAIEIVVGVHVPGVSGHWVIVDVRVDAAAVMTDGEQAPSPPTGEHELIVTVEAGNVAQVSPLIVSVMVLASKLLVPPP
jgi:hypothetical protein